MNRRRQGALSETIAARFLEQAGYEVVVRNYRTRKGEIDLIVRNDEVLAFVEVKMRSTGEFGLPEQAVDERKQTTIIQVASEYLSQFDPGARDIRFDIVSISGLSPDPEIKHLPAAFTPDPESDNALTIVSTGGQSDPPSTGIHRDTIRYKGGYLNYYRAGQGQVACIFCHGFPTSGQLWREVMEAVGRKGFLCIAPDQVGLGESVGSEEMDYSLRGQADCLRELIERLNLRRVVLIGQDTGGGVVQHYLARYPERVEAAVLTNCVTFDNWPVWPVRIMKAALGVKSFSFLLNPRFSLPLFRFGLRTCFTEVERDQLAEAEELYLKPLFRTQARQEQFLKYIRAMNSQQTQDMPSKLETFDKPVLVAWAPDDRYLKPATGRRLAELFPKGSFKMLDRGGHLHPHERPGQFAEVLLKFLGKDFATDAHR